MSEYRPEIDGLRAVAIVPVVLYHFGVAGVAGGFVGVDVFFVISGFLIGNILWAELQETGRVRLGHFFLRRIRRLAPAYYVMALGTFVAGWFILMPFEFRELGKELISATVYLSNVYFWQRTGYFDVLEGQRPLLHTWSLSVEEQFYLFLPVLLLVLARLRRALPWILLVIAIISLVASILVTQTSQSTAFYLFPLRAWELLSGVLLAIAARQTGFGWRLHAAVSWIGLALVGVAIIVIEPGAGFPGLWALLPVAGAVMLIANGKQDNPVNRLLVTPPFLFFGAISYSLYLWHWPVVTLATYYVGGEPGPALTAALIALSIVLAWLSLKLVENPVRKGRLRTVALLSGYGTASAVVIGLGALIYLQNGLIQRFGPEARPAIQATRGFHQDWSRCTTPNDGVFAGMEICPIGPEGPPQLLIWGDSHARAFKEGLEHAAFENDTPALLIWRGGCPPLLGLAKSETATTPFEDAACTDHNSQIGAALSELPPSIQNLLLIGRWAYYAEGAGIGADAENLVTLTATSDAQFSGNTPEALLGGAFDQTLTAADAAGLMTFVLRQAPEIFEFSSRAAARGLAYAQVDLADLAATTAQTSRAALDARNEIANRVLGNLDKDVIDSWPPLCTETACSALHNGQVYYFDNNHLTNGGAIAVSEIFAPVFLTEKSPQP